MKLPETWRKVRLGTICQINPRLDTADKPTNDMIVSFVPMAAVDEVDGIIAKFETREYAEVSKGFTPFRNGDVLFAKITPSMENGKAAVATNLVNGLGFGSTEFHVLRPSEFLLAEYLLHFIRQPRFRKYAAAAFVGSGGQQRVPSAFLARTPIPLPPLNEQQRIVAILDEANELRRTRQKVIQEAQELNSNIFLSMFGNPIHNAKEYKRQPLGKLGKLDRGRSKHRPRDVDFLFGGSYPFIQTGDVTNSEGWITAYSQTYSEAGLAQSRLWPKGTLCITIAANIARTGILDFDACFPDSVVGFTPNNAVTSEYVMFAIGFFQAHLEKQAPQAAQKNINLEILRNLSLPAPPIEQQIHFSNIVGEIRKSLIAMGSAASSLDTITEQLSRMAFSGQLTETWRVYHHRELEAAARERDRKLAGQPRITLTEHAPEERRISSLLERNWLKSQWSEVQQSVWDALIHQRRGSLTPSEEGALTEFRQQCFQIEHLENADDRILRALEQLAGMGLIAKVSVRNEEGEYVTAYRPLRDEERSRGDDIAVLSGAVG